MSAHILHRSCICGCYSPSHNEPWLQLITLSSPSFRPQLMKPQTSSNPRRPLINPHGGRIMGRGCCFTAIKVPNQDQTSLAPDGLDCMLIKEPAVNIKGWFVFLPWLFTSSLYYLRLVPLTKAVQYPLASVVTQPKHLIDFCIYLYVAQELVFRARDQPHRTPGP